MSEVGVRDHGTGDSQRRIEMVVSPRNVEDEEGRDQRGIRGPVGRWVPVKFRCVRG